MKCWLCKENVLIPIKVLLKITSCCCLPKNGKQFSVSYRKIKKIYIYRYIFKTTNLFIIFFNQCFQYLIKINDNFFLSWNFANFSEIACSFSVSYHQNYPQLPGTCGIWLYLPEPYVLLPHVTLIKYYYYCQKFRTGSSDLRMRTTNENGQILVNLGETERISVYTK